MFTQRAVLLGFVAFCFYLIAVVNTLPTYYYALTWLSMGMLAASLGVALLSLVGLDCKLELTRSRGAASLGEEPARAALIAMSLSNAGTLNKTNVVLELRVKDTRKQVHALRFLLEAVPSGTGIESVLPLGALGRGSYELQDAKLIGSDVLGLFGSQKRVKLRVEKNREIIIGPPILGGEGNGQGGANGYLMGMQRAVMARHGDELRGTRPYAPGDDLRHVHWKSSARAGELVVKEWEQTGQTSALVMWDGAAQTAWGAGDFASGEWGLILSASLCHGLLAGGTPCDFARLDASPLLIETRALVGGELPTELTDALCLAESNRAVSLEETIQHLPRLGVRLGSKPILVSASLSNDLVRAVSFLRARGAQVQVVLIDAASLAARSGHRHFEASAPGVQSGARSGAKAWRSGAESNAGALPELNFGAQVNKLREVGALVVAVSPRDDESAEITLRAALRAVSQRRD